MGPPRPSLGGILLAAGLSRRLQGPNKLTLLIDGEALVRRTARTLIAAGVDPLVVVLGREAARVGALLDGLALHRVENPDPEAGQGASLKLGLQALAKVMRPAGGREASSDFLVCLADLVLLQPRHIAELHQAFEAQPQAMALVAHHEGQRGHPVFFRSVLLPALIAQSGGPRAWLEAHPGSVLRWPVTDPAFITDLDTPQDLLRLIQRADGPEIRLPDGAAPPG